MGVEKDERKDFMVFNTGNCLCAFNVYGKLGCGTTAACESASWYS